MANESYSDPYEDAMRAYETCTRVVPPIMGVIFFVGLVGNALVIFTFCRQRNHRAVTYYYIVNLAVTDLAFLLVCIPTTAIGDFMLSSWVFGEFLCKFTSFMKQVTGLATCTTLTAMTIDRYRAIVYPFESLHSRTSHKAIIVSVTIWTASCLLSLPLLILKKTKVVEGGGQTSTVCYTDWPSLTFKDVYFVGTLLIVYVIPLSIIGVCYAILLRKLWGYSVSDRDPGGDGSSRMRIMQRKRHITFMILIVVMIFMLSWFPLHAFHAWSVVTKPKTSAATLYMRAFSLCLAYSNSSVNPIVYAFAGVKFRERMRYACRFFCPYRIRSRQDTIPLGPVACKYGQIAPGIDSSRRTKMRNSSECTETTRDANQQITQK